MTKAVYLSLADRVVFITGGGSGIGAAIVEAFGRQKAKVAFVDIDVEASLKVRGALNSLCAQSYLPIDRASTPHPGRRAPAFGDSSARADLGDGW